MPTGKRKGVPSGGGKEKRSKIDSPHPVGKHIIALRTFHRSLVDHKRKLQINKPVGSLPELPEYPPDYPTYDYLEELRKGKQGTVKRLQFSSNFSKEEIDKMRKCGIKTILFQVGYDIGKMENDDECLNFLSCIVDTFLQSFTNRMLYHKYSVTFRRSPDLYNLLQTVLQEIGFQGIQGIAKYYSEDFVTVAEILRNECKKELILIKSKSSLQNDSHITLSAIKSDLPYTSATMDTDLPTTSTATGPDLSTISTN